MKYLATIDYKGARASFSVEDCGFGPDWGRTRAIAHFFHGRKGGVIPQGRSRDGLRIMLEATK